MQRAYLLLLTLLFFGFIKADKTEDIPIEADSPPTDYIAFQNGEKLKYDLNYNGISGGEANFEIKEEPKIIAGKPHYHISVVGRSYPALDPFYKVRDFYESYIDEETLLPSVFIRDVTEGKYKNKEYYIFDRAQDKILANKKTYSAATKDLHDIVSAFYYFRCLDFSDKPIGYTVNVNSFFDEEILPMGVKLIGKATVSSPIGKIKCNVFRPKLIKGRVFQDQEDMTLYVSDDKNQIPVRIESKVYLGSVRADIARYSGLKFPFTSKVARK